MYQDSDSGGFPPLPSKRRKGRKKKKTRRAISVAGLTYARVKAWQDENPERSISGLVEELLATYLDGAGVPVATAPWVNPDKRARREEVEEITSSQFTF